MGNVAAGCAPRREVNSVGLGRRQAATSPCRTVSVERGERRGSSRLRASVRAALGSSRPCWLPLLRSPRRGAGHAASYGRAGVPAAAHGRAGMPAGWRSIRWVFFVTDFIGPGGNRAPVNEMKRGEKDGRRLLPCPVAVMRGDVTSLPLHGARQTPFRSRHSASPLPRQDDKKKRRCFATSHIPPPPPPSSPPGRPPPPPPGRPPPPPPLLLHFSTTRSSAPRTSIPNPASPTGSPRTPAPLARSPRA